MAKRFFIAAAVNLMLTAGNAAATELPTFEKEGFPITAHQVQVIGAADVQEHPSATALIGTPASPHQVLVLRPRRQ